MTFNELITKIGVDKILHFAIGGLIVALFTLPIALQEPEINTTTLLTPLAGTVVVAIFSWFKEAAIDDEFSWEDILASVLGAIPVFIATALGVLFHILSN